MSKSEHRLSQIFKSGRLWNPYKGGLVPFNRSFVDERLEWQRNQAAALLAKEISRSIPRPGRIDMLKRCMHRADCWRKSYVHLLKIIMRRCEMFYVPLSFAKEVDIWDDNSVSLHYMGSGIIGIFDNNIRLEMDITRAAWITRHAKSREEFWWNLTDLEYPPAIFSGIW
jgi:hypothetical protein